MNFYENEHVGQAVLALLRAAGVDPIPEKCSPSSDCIGAGWVPPKLREEKAKAERERMARFDDVAKLIASEDYTSAAEIDKGDGAARQGMARRPVDHDLIPRGYRGRPRCRRGRMEREKVRGS
jgi:hypothetical protein